ncbi:NAD-dependent epimerase/dehydratase family protein [Lapillicoccus jejuensis]|uniref:Nucleoside-diphosphate-sugar epimerase n=1 Tax=Lapillicoccus jejuensis TaxID=402171 RepID=A0A542DYX9_9MICO|nr:NAD-dependent epimerase/dehydratase family protein [Lapillicoccus jejuensis]TQJ08259.1 nucleoside-diphosphate-sugar epimerase [Lapillicoccus jejuensis]
MRVVVVGGTGHIGTWLVPRLVAGGHEVVVLSRGRRAPYPHPAQQPDPQQVVPEQVVVDRDAEDAAGTFGTRVRSLEADAVVDLVCFTPDSARALTDALAGSGTHLVHVGTIWAHGPSRLVPTREDSPRRPVTPYGVAKAAIEDHLHAVTRAGDLDASVVMPGHISGPGWLPITPAGDLDPGVFRALATGGPVTLPDDGLATLQHVHADDVAAVVEAALDRREVAAGRSWHAVAEQAVTLRAYAEEAARWWGREADLRLLPLEQWRAQADPEQVATTLDHLAHRPCCSMDAVRDELGVRPAHTLLDTVREAVASVAEEHGIPPLG